MTLNVIEVTPPAATVIQVMPEIVDVVEVNTGAVGPAGPQGPIGLTGQGVPTGGSAGQALIKNSGTNYDTSWLFPDYTTLLNVPATFTPSAHAHAAADVTSGVFDIARIPNIPAANITQPFATITATSTLTVASDTNATTILGRIRIDSRTTDTAYFSHFDMSTANNFALRQGATGATTLNTASGSNMLFAVDGSTVTTLSSGGLWIMGSGANTARLNVNALASGIGLIVRANATTPGNIQQWQDSSGNILSSVSSNGAITSGIRDTGTNDTQNVLVLGRNSTGTPIAGFAERLLFQLKSSTTENRDAAAIDARWTTTTDATRTSALDFYNVISGVTTRVMTILNNRVGINNSSPAHQLDVAGTGNQRIAARSTDNSNPSFFWETGSHAYSAFLDVAITAGNLCITRTAGGLTQVAIGETLSPQATLHVHHRNTSTDDARNVLILSRNSTGTPVAGLGSRLLFQLESGTTENQDAAQVETSWVVATHTSRTARVRHLVNDFNGLREAIRYEADGSAARLGFLGANAIARIDMGVWGSLTMQQQIDALRDVVSNFGFASHS